MVQTRSKRESVAKVLEVKADKPVDNDDVKVPDAILNFNRASAQKKKVDPEVKQARNNSNLLITANPNISINSLTTDDWYFATGGDLNPTCGSPLGFTKC